MRTARPDSPPRLTLVRGDAPLAAEAFVPHPAPGMKRGVYTVPHDRGTCLLVFAVDSQERIVAERKVWLAADAILECADELDAVDPKAPMLTLSTAPVVASVRPVSRKPKNASQS